MCRRISGVERYRPLEIRNGAWNARRIERFEPHAAFGERLIRFEAARFPVTTLHRARLCRPKRFRQLRDDPILQLKHLFERAVRLGVCSRLAGRRIDDASGDAETIARPLEAADDGQVDGESSAERRQVATDAADGFDDLDAIDHAQRGRAQIVADGFSDS